MSNKYVKLGIDELDRLLEPGLLKGAVVLVAGHPGVGKTTFAAQVLYNRITSSNERGAYISFAESREDFYKYMENIGFNFKELEEKGLFKFISLLTVSDIDLVNKVVEVLMELLDHFNPNRIVIDGFTALVKILSVSQLRAFLHSSLIPILKEKTDLSILISDLSMGTEIVGYGVEEFIVDAVILMKLLRSEYGYERIMEFRKIRGVSLNIIEIPYVIHSGIGIKPLLLPREADETYSSETDIETGIELFDKTLNGLKRGAQILVTGISGSGKSILTTYLVGESARKGYRTVYVSLDEPEETVRCRMEALGYSRFLDNEILIKSIDVSSFTLLEVIDQIYTSITDEKPDILVIDGARVLYKLSNKKLFWKTLLRLTTILKRKRVTSIYVYTSKYPKEKLPIDTLVDMIIILKLEVMGDRLERSFFIWKNKYGRTPEKKLKIEVRMGRGAKITYYGGGNI